MPAFTVFDPATGEHVRGLLPRLLRRKVPPTIQSDGSYVLMLFAHKTGDVVRSPVVRKALTRVPSVPSGGLVAAGANFTQEAREELARHDAIVVSLGDFHWTDSSAESIRHR